MKFADVILPLALNGPLSYSVPSTLQPLLKVGMRVVVPLGKSKKYVGVVVRLHDETPNVKTKEICGMLDKTPTVLPLQLELWQWISEYYLSPIGDVMKAAMPAKLKTEGAYKQRMETFLTLAQQYRNRKAIELLPSVLKRSRKQWEALECFLHLSHWDSLYGKTEQLIGCDVARDELMNECHCTLSVIKGLTDKGILCSIQKAVDERLNREGDYHPELIKPLSVAQNTALESIKQQFENKNVVLLDGVTSSGKTEIYIHLIEETIAKGKQVLYLLPEIALTVQITDRLQRVFGSRLGIYHSRYSDAERVDIWRKQLSERPYDILLGARSACLLPFQNLGLVIIDEEHETSFKQQEPAPRYHARSVAIMLASMTGAKTLLGTATPSVESYTNASSGKYGLVRLQQRFKGIQLPEIQVVDIKDLRHRKMMKGPFSPILLAAVREAISQGQQAILFQNRRGFSPMIECHECGWTPRCTNCDVTLTYHRRLGQLTCHYCGMTYKVPTECPCCGSKELRAKGFGTEKIEESIRELIPEARVARMDLDTTRSRNAYARIIGEFSARRTNLLIGTQMVSKGLDFGGVKVVGILDADSMLNYPDFRAYEHAFTMMSQVAGRAGRKEGRGLVILQTRQPDLPLISQVVNNDYEAFFKAQIAERREFRYPPFTHLIYVFLRHRNNNVVESASIECASRLREVFGERVLGPDKPSVARIKQMNIRKIVLKLENGIDGKRVRKYLINIQQAILSDKHYASLQIFYDVDPI